MRKIQQADTKKTKLQVLMTIFYAYLAKSSRLGKFLKRLNFRDKY